LRKLKDAGIRLALDDFGTGYSALSYLQHFPFDKLKIDQSFVRPLGTEAGSPALLGAIVRMARSLGLSVTVEGIETLIQRELLKALDCDDGQGYLFSPPLLASALRDFIEEAS
jgi:EAL domain-containing protein (putative c-di-GMP-specific phosphodiesterase class I)